MTHREEMRKMNSSNIHRPPSNIYQQLMGSSTVDQNKDEHQRTESSQQREGSLKREGGQQGVVGHSRGEWQEEKLGEGQSAPIAFVDDEEEERPNVRDDSVVYEGEERGNTNKMTGHTSSSGDIDARCCCCLPTFTGYF